MRRRRLAFVALAACLTALLWGGTGYAVFISVDIGTAGDPNIAGSVSPAGEQPPGPVSITGGGSDIWGTADHCHYWYDSWSGDFYMIARFTDLSGGADTWRKAGPMIRTDTSAGSAMTFIAATPQQVAIQWRDSAGGDAAWPGSFMTGSPSDEDAPFWLSMKRVGNDYTFRWAPDVGGSPGTWSAPETHTNAGIPTDALVGIAVTSHNNGQTTTATFDNVSIQQLATPVGRLELYDWANIGGAAYAEQADSTVVGPVHWELQRWYVTASSGVMSEWYFNYQAQSLADFQALAGSGRPHSDFLISQIAWGNVGGGYGAPGYPPETGYTGDMGNFSVRHFGQILIPDDPANPGAPRSVTFHDHNDDWAVLIIDGSVTGINDGSWTSFDGTQGTQGQYTTLSLTPGWHDFEFYESEGSGGDNAVLLWDYDPDTNSFGAADVAVPTAYLQYVTLTAGEVLAMGDYNVGDPTTNGIFYNIGSNPGETFFVRLAVSYQGETWYSEIMEFTGVPEPATCLLLAGGLVALARRRRRSRK